MSDYDHAAIHSRQMNGFWERIGTVRMAEMTKHPDENRPPFADAPASSKAIAPCFIAAFVFALLATFFYGQDVSPMLAGLSICSAAYGSAIPMFCAAGSFGSSRSPAVQVTSGILTIAGLVFAGGVLAVSLSGDAAAMASMTLIMLMSAAAWFRSFAGLVNAVLP